MEKTCTRCGETKPLEAFGRNVDGQYGRRGRCRVCRATAWSTPERKRQRRDANREYGRERRARDPKYRLSRATACNIRASLVGGKRGRGWESIVGYSLDDLMAHLEQQFQPGMTWENYGEWHVDHIVPIAAFNYSAPEHVDFKRCWSLDNLQPLWASDNAQKRARLDAPFQPCLDLAV